MDILELQPYLLFLVAGSALITAIVTGGRYFHKRYTDGLDRRIDGCIREQAVKNTKKINKLERKIALIIELAVPARKRKLLQATEMDTDE